MYEILLIIILLLPIYNQYQLSLAKADKGITTILKKLRITLPIIRLASYSLNSS